jgi:hypothetical protein
MLTNTAPANRLDSIATRQRNNVVRDALFAACVVLATAVSLVSVSTASHAASTTPASQLADR